MSIKPTLAASLSIAMLATIFSCSQDEPAPNPTPPPVEVNYGFCDYGPVTEYGGGCYKMESENACDLQYGQVVSYCPGDEPPTPTTSSSSGSTSQTDNPGVGSFWCYYSVSDELDYCYPAEKKANEYKDLYAVFDMSSYWTKERVCNDLFNKGVPVDVCPNYCEPFDAGAYYGTAYLCEKGYGTECDGYCRLEMDNCVRIATDPDGKYGAAIATCEAATTNCKNYSPHKEIFTNDICKGTGIPGTFTDSRDGKSYKTVKLGTQTWMAENLNYNATGSRCYNDSEANCTKYGKLYNWETAKTACPAGWHLPSSNEWVVLEDYAEYRRGVYVPDALKAKSGWNDGDNGTDDYSFTALPGGFCRPGYGTADAAIDRFSELGENGYWWTSDDVGPNSAAHWGIYDGISGVPSADLNSVRCLQN